MRKRVRIREGNVDVKKEKREEWKKKEKEEEIRKSEK